MITDETPRRFLKKSDIKKKGDRPTLSRKQILQELMILNPEDQYIKNLYSEYLQDKHRLHKYEYMNYLEERGYIFDDVTITIHPGLAYAFSEDEDHENYMLEQFNIIGSKIKF